MDNDLYIPGQKIHLKVGLYGDSQVGKTHLALSAPGPVAVYDAEGSLDALARKFPDARGVKQPANIVNGAIAAITKAKSGGYGEHCASFVLDSWTLLENHIRSQHPHPNAPLAHHEINSEIEQGLLRAIDGPTKVNLIVIARKSNEWNADIKKGTIGFRPDAHKKFTHALDLVFHMTLDRQTGKRVAVVYKTRFPDLLPLNKTIADLSWSHLQPIFQGSVKAGAAQSLDDEPPAPPANVISLKELNAKFKAIEPEGSLKAWLIEHGYVAPDATDVSAETRMRADAEISRLLERSA